MPGNVIPMPNNHDNHGSLRVPKLTTNKQERTDKGEIYIKFSVFGYVCVCVCVFLVFFLKMGLVTQQPMGLKN